MLSRSLIFFFFQAEDGIRDLVRSRGLGDVYKRQELFGPTIAVVAEQIANAAKSAQGMVDSFSTRPSYGPAPVSYTHLTLPTSDLV